MKTYFLYNKNKTETKNDTGQFNRFTTKEDLLVFLWGKDVNDFVFSMMSSEGYCSMNLSMVVKNYKALETFLDLFVD
jgi:hypothetical protein